MPFSPPTLNAPRMTPNVLALSCFRTVWAVHPRRSAICWAVWGCTLRPETTSTLFDINYLLTIGCLIPQNVSSLW